jgi:uncharacterized protein
MMKVDVRIPIGTGDDVSGVLHLPVGGRSERGIVLAHGAGNDMHLPLLAFLAEGLAQAGFLTLRFNFLYKEKGRNLPDSQEVLYRAWEGAYRFLASHPEHRPETIIAAGKSLGARMASQMVAEGLIAVDRLIFLGYPLHPPGKKDQLRDRHLYGIEVPMLFFSGSRDQLCDLALLQPVLERLKAPWALEVIEGGDHSFNVPKSAGLDPQEIHGRILHRVIEWLKE